MVPGVAAHASQHSKKLTFAWYTFHASINQRVISIMTAVLFALALPR
jgi:hypothetical protein